MDAVAVTALESVTVEQREEELEVFLLARMWGCCHEEQVAANLAQELAKDVALGLLELLAEIVG